MGLDIHRDIIVACLAKGEIGADPEIEIRSFSTLIPKMKKLREWVLLVLATYFRSKVQALREKRERRTRTGRTSLFSGILYCNECKQRMYFCSSNDPAKYPDYFVCSTLRKDSEKCGGSYIKAAALEELVLEHR